MSELIFSFLETASFTVKQENLTGQNSVCMLSDYLLKHFRDASLKKLNETKKRRNKYRNRLSFS